MKLMNIGALVMHAWVDEMDICIVMSLKLGIASYYNSKAINSQYTQTVVQFDIFENCIAETPLHVL